MSKERLSERLRRKFAAIKSKIKSGQPTVALETIEFGAEALCQEVDALESKTAPLHRVLDRIADRYPDGPCSGEHLGAVRSWIQTTFRNGERVTWGSNQELANSGLTVWQMEFLACRIKDAVVQEIRGMVETENSRAEASRQDPSPCRECSILSDCQHSVKATGNDCDPGYLRWLASGTRCNGCGGLHLPVATDDGGFRCPECKRAAMPFDWLARNGVPK